MKKLLLVVFIGIVIYIVYCQKHYQKKDSTTAIYSAEYNTSLIDDGPGVVIEVTVNGPAAELVATLTGPEGVLDTQIIKKEQMVSNYVTVKLPIQNPRDGTYVVIIKTVDPERVISQRDIPLSLGQLVVSVYHFFFTPDRSPEGYLVDFSLEVTRKNGNLPIRFTGFLGTLDGEECSSQNIVDGKIMKIGHTRVNVRIRFFHPFTIDYNGRYATKGPLYNERHVIKGMLFYNKGDSMPFEKELTNAFKVTDRIKNWTYWTWGGPGPGAGELSKRR